MTLVVRDEEDVLPANLDYHLAEGVDVVLVIDHGSSDRTPEILSEYERTGRVRVFRDEDRAHNQSARVNRLLRIATEEHGADWIIHCDADEFWVPLAGSLRDVFAAVPERYGYMVVNRTNFVPVQTEGEEFYRRMVVRERRSLNLRGTALEPKVAQRPEASNGVAPGNHSLEAPVMDPAPDIGAVEVVHFPIRTFKQFQQKVVNTGVGYELLEGRASGIGIDQLELLERHRQGTLREYYAGQCPDRGQVEKGLDTGELVADNRVRVCLEGAPSRPEESQLVQEAFRRAWLTTGAMQDAANNRIAQLTTERDAWHAEAIKLGGLLETIESSRIMRMSEPARRLYYKMRPGG